MASQEQLVNDIKELVSPLATMISAFCGAWFAYRLQDRVRARKTKAAQVSAANAVIFTITQMLTSLVIFQRDYINPHRNDTGIAFSMKPLFEETSDKLEFDFNSLSFLIDSEHGEVVMNLYIQQKRYNEAIALISYRSKMHLEVIQPILETSGVVDGISYPDDHFKKALGACNYANIVQSTAQLVHYVDSTIISLENIKNLFLQTIQDKFPDVKFINFTLVE